jgi:hypothetical protein
MLASLAVLSQSPVSTQHQDPSLWFTCELIGKLTSNVYSYNLPGPTDFGYRVERTVRRLDGWFRYEKKHGWSEESCKFVSGRITGVLLT